MTHTINAKPTVETTSSTTTTDPLQSPETQFTHITVKHHPNGIHELVFRDSLPQTVDELFAYQLFLNTTIGSTQVITQLWDARKGLLPISKTIQESRKLLAQSPTTVPHRIALIYPQRQNALLQPGSVLLNMLPLGRLKIRYFSEKAYDAAIAWLLSSQ